MARVGSKGGDSKRVLDDPEVLRKLSRKLAPGSPHLKLASESRVQSLWAGYGSVSKAEVVAAKASAGKSARGNGGEGFRLVVKQVDAPGGSGVGHERKIRSYDNEAVFYKSIAEELLANNVAVPEPLLVDTAGPGKLTLVMRDQREQFPRYSDSLSLTEAKAALSWLAAFHAFFWGRPKPDGLWQQGTFWHLDTRQEEFEDIGWTELKESAHAVDRYLKGEGRHGAANVEHMTVLHGDFKQANLFFSNDGKECAAHDFQYCGAGLGAKDIAYLFCAGLSSRYLPSHEEELLAHYHAELMGRLRPRGLGENYTMDVLREHFGYALLDFVRFMDGWGYWGNNRWAAEKVERLLKSSAAALLND